jgi:uncharacterized protein (UPF0210 family)
MNIRSVTCFVNVDETLPPESLRGVGELARSARESATREGYQVQTTRLAVQPLHRIIHKIQALEFALAFEQAILKAGFDYGALAVESEELFDHIADAIRTTEHLFCSIRIASLADGINLHAVQAAARVIHELAHTTADGFGNFRFTAAANCPPGVPFFPSAYHDGSASSFAFATEAADLAVQAFTDAQDLDNARTRLIALLERHGARLGLVGEGLEQESGLRFAGIDFSMAPYPEEGRSLATAFERLTGAPFGTRGTLFAAAFVTDCLRRAKFRRAGFSGLMLPMMEDWTMAARSQQDLYSLDSLLLYSTVCGTGLDTVPLAGDTTEEAVAALLLDLAALAVKLDKPLTARLIPVPGVRAGEATRFSFEYFANARAFEVRADRELKVFGGSERVDFRESI